MSPRQKRELKLAGVGVGSHQTTNRERRGGLGWAARSRKIFGRGKENGGLVEIGAGSSFNKSKVHSLGCAARLPTALRLGRLQATLQGWRAMGAAPSRLVCVCGWVGQRSGGKLTGSDGWAPHWACQVGAERGAAAQPAQPPTACGGEALAAQASPGSIVSSVIMHTARVAPGMRWPTQSRSFSSSSSVSCSSSSQHEGTVGKQLSCTLS